MGHPRHFLDLDRVPAPVLKGMLALAHRLKAARGEKGKAARDDDPLLPGRFLAMIFEQPSTRTRVSFDLAIRQLGGDSLVLTGDEIQLGHGETPGDTARVLSRLADAITVRTPRVATLEEIAEGATVPVINALTARTHPCQIMADLLTVEERLDTIAGKVVAWCGDGNNVAHSWIQAAAPFGFEMRLACPARFRPDADIVADARAAGGAIALYDTAEAAVAGADVVVTDAWVSMSDDPTQDRTGDMRPFQVNDALMSQAGERAVFMHCLPAHRNEEVTDSVIDGPQSAVWDEAENRLHAQKAILAWCLDALEI